MLLALLMERECTLPVIQCELGIADCPICVDESKMTHTNYCQQQVFNNKCIYSLMLDINHFS